MAMRSICPSVVLEDPKEDYKNGYRAEQFRVGKQAIYMAAFPGTKYLPFAGVDPGFQHHRHRDLRQVPAGGGAAGAVRGEFLSVLPV